MAATITQAHVYQRHTRRSEGDRVIHPLPLSFSPLTTTDDCKTANFNTNKPMRRGYELISREKVFAFSC